MAAAVLGQRCELAAAAALAGLDDPLPALGEALAAGILAEQPGGAVAGIGFSHLLGQRAVYGDLSPARRRRLHQRAAGLVDRNRALGHRVAAAVGPDDGLAAELEAAARESRWDGRTAQAAGWLAQAAAVSGEPEAADRRLLDALEILVTCGDVAQAEVLAARAAAAGPGARRSWLLGTLDFLAGRIAAAEARLLEAWQAHDPAGRRPRRRSRFWLAVLCLLADRLSEAIEWGERAAAAGAASAAARHRALGVLAIALVAAGRGPEGLARLAFLPPAPSQVPREDTDTLALRGMARVLAEAGRGGRRPFRRGGQAAATAAHRQPVPKLPGDRRVAPRMLGQRGRACRAGGLARPRRRAGVGARLGALCRCGGSHAARRLGCGQRARRNGHPGRPGHRRPEGDRRGRHRPGRSWPWPAPTSRVSPMPLRPCALQAGRSCASSALRLAIPGDRGAYRHGPRRRGGDGADRAGGGAVTGRPASAQVDAARLRGDLAAAAGNDDAAAAAFETAWRRAQGLRVPLTLAQLEISDARGYAPSASRRQPSPGCARPGSA